eukprot:GHVU01061297.1.p2 GENE.GHVU01061297.1~~GHVU01061297.1.p2  ORF type:complete len:131 (-),score=15.79 GHVU01061297.1:636-1028(-)
MSPIDVNGIKMHPVYEYLKAHSPSFRRQGSNSVAPISWNFGKFLVDSDGRVAKYFGPRTEPVEMIDAIMHCLPTLTEKQDPALLLLAGPSPAGRAAERRASIQSERRRSIQSERRASIQSERRRSSIRSR